METEQKDPSFWKMQQTNAYPIAATAIHDGHEVRNDVLACMAIDEASRLREEDPHTAYLTKGFYTSIRVNRSRFELDLNRPREKAVYRIPEDAWGLDVWHTPLSEAQIAHSLDLYDDFYATVENMLQRFFETYNRFVVLDLHSYCHRRGGPDAPPEDPQLNPDINVGTGTLDRDFWAPVIDNWIAYMRSVEIGGRFLDVRENVKFRGGHFSRWGNTTFSHTGCFIAIEFKKFFMDEWTGEVDKDILDQLQQAVLESHDHILEGYFDIQDREFQNRKANDDNNF